MDDIMLNYAVVLNKTAQGVQVLSSEQTCMSYAMPDQENGIPVEKYFLYTMAYDSVHGRPWAMVTADMARGDILLYEDCRVKDFMDTERHPLHEKIDYSLPREIGLREYKMQQELMKKLYERVRLLAFREELSGEEQELLRKYLILLDSSVPADLIPYYHAIGKNFIAWTEKILWKVEL